MLYIISTPIGNLEDITYRAVRMLSEVDYVLAEDTRRTALLLHHFSIKKAMVSFNDINDTKKTPFVIKDLQDGKNIALVSDSGTPLVSDPGFFLVRECVKNNLLVSPIPGASAILSGLVCSGLPTDRFTFYGFLPKTSGKRGDVLKLIKERKETAVFYESPHRIVKILEELKVAMPDKSLVIGRELTKKFEEFVRGRPQEVITYFENKNPKGEFVVIIS